MIDIQYEEPCKTTGHGCNWTYDEWEDEEGDWWSNCYCLDCSRPRDFSLHEYKELG